MKECINNININYSIDGNSEKVILLLHGWGANITLFNATIKDLSNHHKVYALDMPGFGDSEEPPCSWNVDSYVDFVIEFIRKMNIQKLSILGHSFGGRVIIKMVNRNDLPFAIGKLILIDSAGILPKRSTKQKLKVRFFKLAKKVVSNKLMVKLFPDALENLKSKFGSDDYKNATPIMRESLIKVVNEDLEPLLPNIKQSTLLIWGEKDTATPISDAEIMEKLIPDAGLVRIKNAGHYSFLEQPNLVNRVLESFLISKE